jgi:threonine/homoserine/homoserine lactone efflux protein
MSAAELGALLVFATAMAFTPGPNTTLSAALGANRGLSGALPFVLGVPLGWGLLLAGCVMGLGSALDAAPGARRAVQALGLCYMLWLAWRLSRSARMSQADAGLRVGFAQGIALQFVNVKAWMNALLISAGWVTVGPDWSERVWIVLPLMMAFGLASNLTYAIVGSSLRHWLAQGRRLSMFNRALAAVLVATAIWMALPLGAWG